MNPKDYCIKCKNKGFNPDVGLICGLTNLRPNFIDHCDDYVLDSAAQEALDSLKDDDSYVKIASLENQVFILKILVALIYAVWIGSVIYYFYKKNEIEEELSNFQETTLPVPSQNESSTLETSDNYPSDQNNTPTSTKVTTNRNKTKSVSDHGTQESNNPFKN